MTEWIKWINETCCCCGYQIRKKKKKILTEEQIKEKALEMLAKWKVDMYANNRFLYKIPEKQISDQYALFVRDLRIDNIYL